MPSEILNPAPLVPKLSFRQGLTLRRIGLALQTVVEGCTASGAARRLRIAETVTFGEKRFVALVEADGERLIIGGAAGEIKLLKTLRARSGEVGESQ